MWEKHLLYSEYLSEIVCHVSLGSQQEMCRSSGDDRPCTELQDKQEVFVWQKTLFLCRSACKYALWSWSLYSYRKGWAWSRAGGSKEMLFMFSISVLPKLTGCCVKPWWIDSYTLVFTDWIWLLWLLTPCLASRFQWFYVIELGDGAAGPVLSPFLVLALIVC